MTMCSIGPDGSIHAVAMWYGFLDGCVTVETKAKSQKVQNLRRDPRLTLLFEAGRLLRGAARRGAGGPGRDHRRPRSVVDPRRQRVRALYRPLHRREQRRSSRPCSTSGWPSRCTPAHGELGPPQAAACRRDPSGRRRVNFTVDQNVAVAPDVAVAAYGNPAFYEGRPPATTSPWSRWSATTRASPCTSTSATSSPARSPRPCGPSSIRRRCPGSPGPTSHAHQRCSSFTVLPDHYPDRLTCSGTFRFTGATPGPLHGDHH